MKICSKCKENKTEDQFSKDNSTVDKLTRQCKICRSTSFKKWYNDNPEKIREIIERDKEYKKNYYSKPEIKNKYNLKRIKREFNLDSESYLNLLKNQDNKCAICKQEEKSRRVKNLSVDHDHDTNIVRGLLCSNCNRALGLFGDNLEILKNAINYLNKNIER